MTEAMPFLQKTILLSYDPRPFAGGAFSLHRRPAEPEWKRALWGTIPRQGILIP